ncbi:MAG TPA: dicarboxylate/amino acid:cation symporter [Candidatus Eisenbacteria bacterium]|uniref:Dicarboxylate/amino acid:cation symporter n=1 Tax=Eiseniibacteriota bacterium TaxID=2212470 RepID=A0A7V2ATL6_UNCEI|nr:dicarboxylate/amino acid:cation symporter [Candidatus Eisenbacteria bacterium]
MRTRLHTKILIGLVAGVPVGLLLGPRAGHIEFLGRLFILLIRMIVVPLVFSSLFVGTASLGNIRKLGRIGGKTILYYLCTTAIAITIGLVLGNAVRPGSGLDESTKTELLESYRTEAIEKIEIAGRRPSGFDAVVETLLRIVPGNPVASLAEENMLQIIFFALLFGVAITLVPNGKGKPAVDFFEAVSEGMIQLVHLVMKFAPIGVLALIASVVGRFGADILLSLLKYALVVVAGLLVHMAVIYSAAVRLFGGMRPIDFFRGIRPAQLIAFSTSSSNATLPVTMECAEENLGVSEEVSSFVLPLGATINMDGTALYQGVAAVFIAQVYGLSLTLGDQVTIVLMATLASIGAAGVPGIGVITLAMVLQTLGLPLEGIALILGVDRILDMCRTTVNITGDASAAVVVAATEGELERPARGAKGASQ